MNIVLVAPESIHDGVATLGPRAREHVERVLKKKPGDELRLGIRGGPSFLGKIVSIGSELRVELGAPREESESSGERHLLVAVPRPKAVSRLVQTIASFGVSSLTFIDGWKVDKSYFDSPRLEPERLDEDALLGAEQGGHTRVPEVRVVRGFRRFLEDELPALFPSDFARVVFDPRGTHALASDAFESGKTIFAFGPEGGFIDKEIESFERADFSVRSLKTPILTTEIAVASALAQLALLRACALPRKG